MEPKKVIINYALLCKELEKQGKTKEKFSAELGRSKSFVCNMAKNPEQTEDFERTMCLLLGLEPGSLVKEPEKKGMTAAQALTVIRDEILENRRIMQENFEKIWNKLNTNTVQLEKIKDKVNEVSKTDYDKAAKLSNRMLTTGKSILRAIRDETTGEYAWFDNKYLKMFDGCTPNLIKYQGNPEHYDAVFTRYGEIIGIILPVRVSEW